MTERNITAMREDLELDADGERVLRDHYVICARTS